MLSDSAASFYDTLNWEAVRNAYNNIYLPTLGTGSATMAIRSMASRAAPSATYKAAVLTRINFFRAMGGVLGLDPVLSSCLSADL